MKKNLILATLLTLSAISCSKKHDAPPGSKGYLKGKVDGVFFNDLSAQIIIHRTGGLSAPPPTPSIEGLYSDGRITLDFQSYPSVGERILGNNNDKITIYRTSGGVFFAGLTSPFSSQGSGKINIL
ncbi:MAG TPA: hypothetical protein VK588_10060, partial [Chitinophagaceae bacterium]|nr:hypothetical protein [Chitinophagaceae bacterium]